MVESNLRFLQVPEEPRQGRRRQVIQRRNGHATFLLAFGLMLVIEGLMPFVAPRVWRETFRRVTELADGQLRFLGLTSIIVGLVLMVLFVS